MVKIGSSSAFVFYYEADCFEHLAKILSGIDLFFDEQVMVLKFLIGVQTKWTNTIRT